MTRIGRTMRVQGLVLAVAAFVLVACGRGEATSTEAAPTDATIVVHYSRFEPGVITVSVGEPVTITLRNDDPIEHEWIVGAEEVHDRHRTGTEPVHDEIPTEVTLPPYSERVTTVTFDEPGEYAFICHLPGHEAYGMRGVVRVR